MARVYPSHHENPLLYAGFWKRAAAYIVDGFLRTAIALAIILVAGFLDDPGHFMVPSAEYDMGMFGFLGTLSVVLMYFLYYPLFEASRHQATPGKMLLGVIVTDAVGQRLSLPHALGRNLAGAVTWLTSFVLYFGYWMAGITTRKQALHDLMANCLVINRNAEVKLAPDVRYVTGGFPVWAGIVIGLVLIIPFVGILAAIAVPAYMNYVSRATVAATLFETVTHRSLIDQQILTDAQVPTSHDSFGHDWPQTISEGRARVELVDGTLLITFTEQASWELRGETIGMAPHGETTDQINWQCGLSSGQGPRLSGHAGADLTTLEARLLPAHCR